MDEESTNGVQTRKIDSIIIQLSPKEYYCEKNAPHTYLLENSHTSTLYDYDIIMTIKDNTHVKYKVIKGFSNHKMANMLTTKWLQHIYKIWGLIYMVLITQNWYLQPWILSIRSFSNIQRRGDVNFKNARFKESYYTIQASDEKFQPQFGHMELIIHTKIQNSQKSIITTVLASKTKVKSNFEFYWRGPHKADPKKIEETTI